MRILASASLQKKKEKRRRKEGKLTGSAALHVLRRHKVHRNLGTLRIVAHLMRAPSWNEDAVSRFLQDAKGAHAVLRVQLCQQLSAQIGSLCMDWTEVRCQLGA